MNQKRVFFPLAVWLISAHLVYGQTTKPNVKLVENPTQKIQDLQKQVTDLSYQVWLLENNERSVVFDPSAISGYLRLRTNNGDFLISLKNVEPFLDGVKITIGIGNLYSASFNGFKIQAQWGPRYVAADNNWLSWFNSLNKKDFTFPNTLRAGAWNNVSFVLAPAKPDNFGYISLSMETDIISLQQPFP